MGQINSDAKLRIGVVMLVRIKIENVVSLEWKTII